VKGLFFFFFADDGELWLPEMGNGESENCPRLESAELPTGGSCIMSCVVALVVVVTDERCRGLWMDFWRVSPVEKSIMRTRCGATRLNRQDLLIRNDRIMKQIVFF